MVLNLKIFLLGDPPIAKTKALISFAVTAKLICVFVFAYAKLWFSHDAAHLLFLFVGGTLSICFPYNYSKRFIIMKVKKK